MDTPNVDDVDGVYRFSIVSQYADLINSAMNPTCASNVLSLMCHTIFKECKAVDDATTGTQMWLPSLLCRSECDRHLEAWNTCLDDLEKEPDAKRSFDAQMLALVPTCLVIPSPRIF